MKHKALGLAIFELLLVFAIMSGIIIMALAFYRSLSYQNSVRMLQTNVEQLFLAMHNYHRVNCREVIDYDKPAPNNIIKVGLLDPNHNPPPSNPQSILIGDLTTGGFLQDWNADNALVDTSATPYIIQFNRMVGGGSTVWPINIRTCFQDNDIVTCTSDTSVPKSKVIGWQSQVAIHVNKTNADRLKNDLGAACVSTLAGDGKTVTPCSANPKANDYLVWEQASNYLPSSYKNSQSTLRYYTNTNRLYTNDGMATLSDVIWNNTDYYLCGD